jgi:hypothetical protein
MNNQDEALFFFRKLVYAVYLEIGSLQPRIHPEIAEKADITNQFFTGDKQKHTAELYYMVEHKTTTPEILAPFVERTSLTLEDIHRAFVEGDWRNKFGAYNFGGPRWVKITETTMRLRDLIDQQDWEAAADLVFDVKKLKTNQGFLIHMFEWTERRRS